MKAVIRLDIPDYQIGQEVSVYFKDTMCIKSICQEDSTISELKKIKVKVKNYIISHEEWFDDIYQLESCLIGIEDIFEKLYELKGENK